MLIHGVTRISHTAPRQGRHLYSALSPRDSRDAGHDTRSCAPVAHLSYAGNALARITVIVALACTMSGFSMGAGAPGDAVVAQTAAQGPFHTLAPRGILRPAPARTSASVGLPAEQPGAVRRSGTAPTILTQFAGLGYDSTAKPDANAAVGPNDVVEMINAQWGAFSRSGTQLFASTLRAWYGLATTIGLFDVRVVYDPRTGHYFMINLHYDPAGTGIGYIDLSASTTSSATGTWCQYHFLVQDGNNQPDFPGLGFDGQAIYVTMNMYPTGSNVFQYAKLLVLDEAQLSQCASNVSLFTFTQLRNVNGSMAASVQPAQTVDSESAEYLANVNNLSGGTFVTVWTLTNPLNSPTLSAAAVTVHKYFPPPNAPQGGSSSRIFTGGQALLAATVRGGTLWTAHATAITIQSVNLAASQWFAIDPVHATVVQQQIRYMTGQYLYMPAIAVTSDNSAFMIYDISSTTKYVSVSVSSRKATDGLSTLPWTTAVQAGLGSYVHNSGSSAQPWGDFMSATADPSDTTKVWVCGEYAATNNQWATTIAEIGF